MEAIAQVAISVFMCTCTMEQLADDEVGGVLSSPESDFVLEVRSASLVLLCLTASLASSVSSSSLARIHFFFLL